MQVGDKVRVEIEGIGVLENSVMAAASINDN
jgi:2-keto-4-pentenoate hydratase/2-oxohepta-3-ene-1,7-dioic acid hydratase in catechol pathway